MLDFEPTSAVAFVDAEFTLRKLVGPKLSDFLIVVQFLTQKGQESVCFRYNRLEETVQVWAAERENESRRDLLLI